MSGFSTQSNYNLVSDKIHQSIMKKKKKKTNNMVINRSVMKARLICWKGPYIISLWCPISIVAVSIEFGGRGKTKTTMKDA